MVDCLVLLYFFKEHWFFFWKAVKLLAYCANIFNNSFIISLFFKDRSSMAFILALIFFHLNVMPFED